MGEKKKGGILKKVSAISPLAVIIAMVIVLGVNSVNVVEGAPEINITEIKITEPEDGSVINESSIEIKGIIKGTIDNTSIENTMLNATLIQNEKEEIIHVHNGNFTKQVKLSEGENTFTIKVGESSNSITVTHPPSLMSEILASIIPWAIIGIIVSISFLIFFRIVPRRTEDKELFLYTFIIWIASAIIIPIVLSLVLKYLGYGFELFGFGYIIDTIIVIITAIMLPISVFLVYDFIEGTKEREEPSRKEETAYLPIKFKISDEKTQQPILEAKISIRDESGGILDVSWHTDQFGIPECELKPGTYKYEIDPVGRYKPKSKQFSVKRSETIFIPLSKKAGNLTVQVKDVETGNPVQGVNVSVSGMEKMTDEQGKALFSSISIGAKEIKIEEISGVYSSKTEPCEIREDTTTAVSVSIKSHLRIPIDKESKLNALRNQLQDNYRRVSTYDPCIPFYYKSIVDNMVNLVKGMAGKPMLFVGSKNNPGEIIGHLIDAIDLASREIISVMASKRNLDVYSAAMKLERSEVEAKPVDFDDSRVASYIRDVEGFYNSYYHTVQSKLFEIDTNITRKTGEMNVLPVSGLWRVAKTLLNGASASSAETDGVKKGATTLVADIILDYADGMLRDPKIIERLKIMVI